MSDVKRLARWTGWCGPCETERPLVLTEAGERGIRAWLRGIGHEDRTLRLTCCVCGQWQDVPPAEEDLLDEPAAPVVAVRPLGAWQVVVRSAAPAVYPVALPTPRAPVADTRTHLQLVTEGLDLIAIAS